MADRFVSISLEDIVPGEPLPVQTYLYLNHRFILYRNRGDVIDRTTFDRMEQKKVGNFFIRRTDETSMLAWIESCKNVREQDLPISRELQNARQEAHRSMLDIFHSSHPNEVVTRTLKTSEKLVTELMKFPFAAKPLAQLQTHSRSTVDHSVNVSVLSVFLAMNMGYTHVLILRHLASGALLHDVGKSKIEVDENDSTVQAEEKLKKHPELALKFIEDDETISKEAKMIVAQHHECHDGSGYPKGMRGKEIYDLAKIVAIANEFDTLVSESRGTLDERQRRAIEQLAGPLSHKFDPNKLGKAIKILEIGI